MFISPDREKHVAPTALVVNYKSKIDTSITLKPGEIKWYGNYPFEDFIKIEFFITTKSSSKMMIGIYDVAHKKDYGMKIDGSHKHATIAGENFGGSDYFIYVYNDDKKTIEDARITIYSLVHPQIPGI